MTLTHKGYKYFISQFIVDGDNLSSGLKVYNASINEQLRKCNSEISIQLKRWNPNAYNDLYLSLHFAFKRS